jgi:putative ABC transport system permease protein
MNWLQRLFQTRRMEHQLDSELRFHFESQVADKVHDGLPEAEARRATRLQFGGMEQIKQDCRESRGTLWITSIVQDLRFGLRILVKSPGFSVTAILVLALGIGVNTLAFSLYNLIALQSIPVRDPQTLVNLERRSPENIQPGIPWNSIVFYRDNAKTLSAMMATLGGAPLVLDHDEQRVIPSFVSANYFSELGASAAAGRLFDPSREELAASAPVVVLSYPFWQRKYAADPSIVGKTIHLAGKPATVIGVTSQSFANLGTREPDAWLPLMQHTYFVDGSKQLDDPKFEGMIVVTARLAPGATIPQTAQELLALTNRLRKLYPAIIWDNEYIRVSPGAHFLQFDSHAYPILALAGLLVLLILAVACANLGGLLMARGVSRQHEIQIRLSIGAQRARIFRQLFTESLLLAFLGSITALPISYIALRLALIRAEAPTWMSAMPDWRVIVFTAIVAFIAALFFGLMPTLQMIKRTRGRTLAHQFVICVQVAASCVLLILAGLLVRATLHTIYTDPGFGYEQVLSLNFGLSDHGYTPAAARAYFDQLQDRLRAIPGVTAVSMVFRPPLVNDGVMITSIDVDGHTIMIYPNWVGPEFFQTMGIPLLRGRYLQRDDKNAVVLSESLARKRWPNEDPIGKQWKDGKNIVVGVVGNTRAMELNNTDATEIYYPPTDENLPGMFVLVKTAGASDGLASTIKSITAHLDSKLFPTITPLKVGFRKNVAQVEEIATIISLLGGIAILLAVVGLLGLISYAVSQRSKEIAIRLALGADRAEIFSTVLRRFALPVLIGLFAGVGITAALSQVLRRMLYGISGLDPISYLSAIALLIVVLAGAALIPIRRAFQIDIARILHSD